MKHLILLTVAIAAGAALADDGKDYRICGMEGTALRLVESRPRTVRPVVALPVEEAPLEVRTLTMAGELDDFDREALDGFVGTVRIDAGDAGVAKEVYFHGLPLGKFLERERAFRPPVAKCGFSGWADGGTWSAVACSNVELRTHRQLVEELRELVMDEMYRPVAESEDGKNPAIHEFAEQGITNRVFKSLTKPGFDQGTVDIDQLKFGISFRILPKFRNPQSNLLKLMKIYSGVKIKAELNGGVVKKLEALSAEMDKEPGNEFNQLLLAQALIVANQRDSSDHAIHPSDATNLVRRIVGLGERYAGSPARTRLAYELVRPLIGDPANAMTTTRGLTPGMRRLLVERLRASAADPWLADIFEGLLELDLAWYGKGDMFAYCPKKDWGTKVYPHLIAAREPFFRAWKRHPELPEGAFGMLAVEWELYHSELAGRWLGQLWDAELDTPWMYRVVRHRLLTWFKEEQKAFDAAYATIAQRAKIDLESPYRAARAVPPQKPVFQSFPLTNEWRQASFIEMDEAIGKTPFKDAGKVLNAQFDPERRAAVWPMWWHKCRLPLSHEGEIDVEFVERGSATNRIAFGFMVNGTTLAVFSQVTERDGGYRFNNYYSPLGSNAICYPYVLGEKSRAIGLAPDTRRFKMRYRVKDNTMCAWVEGKLVQDLWCVKGIKDEGAQYFEPALIGTGVKVHAIKYRQIPADAGLEEFVE